MGKKHLSEDEIKYIISAETSKAQKEIHELTKATASLKKEERERRKAMIELEAQGKKESEEYRNLSRECKEYTRQISANNKKIDDMRKKMDVNAMSMIQLKKQARDLRAQMDNMVQSLSPREYAELERQLQKVNERMSDLKGNARSITEIAKSEGAVSVMMGNLFTKVSEWAGDTLSRMKDIALEGIEMAEAADGVTRAFRSMNDGTLLAGLRQATKDTVSDLDLMKAAVQANDFRIPLEDLGKYLQFAQLKAQQTGQSVDYMTQSIVTGLGRKSVMILDNLGLSASEINEEMAKTGDFMSAVASIVDKQLAAAGDNYVSAADRATQKSVAFRNAQRELGEALLPLKEKWDTVYGGMEVGTMKLLEWAMKHRAVLVTLTAAVTAYVATQKIATAWNARHASSTMLAVAAEKLHAVQLALSRKAFLAKLIVMDLYRGRCSLATAATEMFNLVLKASPLGMVTALVSAAAVALYMFKGKVDVTDKSIRDLNSRLATEKASLNNLFEELKKTNPGTSERIRLVRELNSHYPDLIGNYRLESAGLREITRAQNEATLALTNRIAAEMKSQAISDYIKNRVSANIETEERLLDMMRSSMPADVFRTLKPAMSAFLQDSEKTLKDFTDQFGKYADMTIGRQVEFVAFFNAMRSDQKSYSSGIDDINKKYEPYIKAVRSSITLTDEEIKKQMEANSLIKRYEEERRKVQDTWSESSMDDLKKKNAEIERLDRLISKLKEVGTAKARAGEDPEKPGGSGKVNKEEMEEDRKAVSEMRSLRDQRLSEETQAYNASLNAFRTSLLNKKITREQFDIWEAALRSSHADKCLSIEKDFAEKSRNLDLKSGKEKESVVKESEKRVQEAEQDSFDARLKAEQTYQDNLSAMREMFAEADTSPKAALDAEYETRKGLLESYYRASLDYARENGKDEVEVTRVYNQAKLALDKKYQKDLADLVKSSRGNLRALQGNAISQEYTAMFNALDELKDAFKPENLMSPDFWKDFGENIGKNMQVLVSTVTRGLSDAFNTFKQIEINNVDEKYNAEIEAAQGNEEKIEQLEKEKAQKKLDIEKKYADVQFAVKASEIIANTALAIMTAYGQLGPIAGAIAAALMGATGAMQLAAANAERQKVKNMTLSGTGGSSKGSGQRVATGREDGGKIDVRRAQDGKLFREADYDPDARGFIDRPTVIVGEGPAGQSKEWVASNAAVENPTVAPVLDMIDKSQQAGTIRTLDLNQAIRSRMAGFASGGNISSGPDTPAASRTGGDGTMLPPQLMEKFARAIIGINENGINASVALSDFEKKQSLRDRSRQIGSKA